MKTLVLGVGNTIRGDDAVGIFIARALQRELNSSIDVKVTEGAGINLLELIEGYDKVVLIDAIHTQERRVGSIYRITRDKLKEDHFLFSSHQMGLASILRLGDNLNIRMPSELIIYAVEIEREDFFEDALNVKVKDSISKVVNLVKRELLTEQRVRSRD